MDIKIPLKVALGLIIDLQINQDENHNLLHNYSITQLARSIILSCPDISVLKQNILAIFVGGATKTKLMKQFPEEYDVLTRVFGTTLWG